MLNVHVLLEQDRVLEVTVDLRFRTEQVVAVHSVDRVQNAVEAGPVIAYVPHPLEQRGDVHVPGAEAKHGEQHGQNGTDEDGQLELDEEIGEVSKLLKSERMPLKDERQNYSN